MQPERIKMLWQHLRTGARMLVGVPDYDRYVAHMRERHPDQSPMSYAEFFRNRQDARYRGGKGPCC